MKKLFESPEAEVTKFSAVDLVSVSGDGFEFDEEQDIPVFGDF